MAIGGKQPSVAFPLKSEKINRRRMLTPTRKLSNAETWPIGGTQFSEVALPRLSKAVSDCMSHFDTSFARKRRQFDLSSLFDFGANECIKVDCARSKN